METRKASLSSLKLCRFCLSQTEDTLGNIYGRSRPPKNIVTLPLKIYSCLSFEVCPSDQMPVYICNRCKFFMDLFYDFKYMCRQSDESILQFIQNGTPLLPMNWSQPLLKFYRMVNKPEVSVMKTVIEGGATVQVTAHESESDDEDDENVYNVKIGDGDEGSKSARVKVITGSDKTDKSKPKRGKDLEEMQRTGTREHLEAEINKNPRREKMESSSRHETKNRKQTKKKELLDVEKEKFLKKDNMKLVETETKGRLQAEVKEQCWACDQCHSTYPLQQLLELHRTLRHRQRTIPCHQCDAKFFSMSDMAVHQQTHVDELKFQCEACDHKFRRNIQLKRHEKVIHADLPQQVCKFCPATFLSATQLKSHMSKHANKWRKNHPCRICDKRFSEKSTLQRHIDNVHNAVLKFACKYCPARFSSPTKLARHVRGNHAGDRSYPCKYCSKSFIKSHHYTRHLRLKHRENIRTCRGPFGETDQYRCEQCEDSFATQDQLIFHSAVHVRKNLICPLCAETFEDVETATAHIKSHANGAQHMCDFCELMFTTAEKLEAHVTTVHEDELRSHDMPQDESSMDAEQEDEDINLKEEDDHMLIEIKKPNEFMLAAQEEADDKMDATNSEDSEPETYNDLTNLENVINADKELEKQASSTNTAPPALQAAPVAIQAATITKIPAVSTPPKTDKPETTTTTASILRKAEEIKKRVIQQSTESAADKKEKPTKSENSNTVGASDKSLRLLEKDLQELKRTTTRAEANKTPAKPVETLRSRRAPMHTSTPKPRAAEEKKPLAATKATAVEKKVPERRVVTKENKEPKDNKDSKANNVSAKEDKKEEKETPKQQNATKNVNNDKSTDEGNVRRSTRPSKIRDYAKMIRDSPQESDDDDDDDSDDSGDDEEYKETEKSITTRPKPQRGNAKPVAKPTPPATPAGTAPRKRGRPRKDASAAKIRKEDNAEEEEESSQDTTEAEKDKDNKVEKDSKSEKDNKVEKENTTKPAEPAPEPMDTDKEDNSTAEIAESAKSETEQKPASGVLVSPSGQTLKKIPIKALPPGVKPLPLPLNARPVAGGEVCEMQIGKKVVKVQKIVMTKAEVEAMAKKGLVEMKDGTMVLKQGIKLPTSTATAESPLKTSMVSGEDAAKESPAKKETKAAPTRCDLDEA